MLTNDKIILSVLIEVKWTKPLNAHVSNYQVIWPLKAVCLRIPGNGRNTLAGSIQIASRDLYRLLLEKSPNLAQPVSTRSSRLLSFLSTLKVKRPQILQQPQQIYLCLTSCEPNATFSTATSDMQFLKPAVRTSSLSCQALKHWFDPFLIQG